MRRRLPVAGVLLVSGAALAGCDLIDRFIDTITGGPGGGTGGFGAVVSGRMEFRLAAYITKSEGCLESGTVGTAFWSGGGSYDAATRTFTTTWDGGDFSDTYFEVRLNDTEEYVESFYARQTQSGVWGVWTYVHEIRGYNVLYSRTEGTSRFFAVDGSDAHVVVDLFAHKAWSTTLGSA
jgi:hypothetical protein